MSDFLSRVDFGDSLPPYTSPVVQTRAELMDLEKGVDGTATSTCQYVGFRVWKLHAMVMIRCGIGRFAIC